MEISSAIGLAICVLGGALIALRVAFRVFPWPLPGKARLRLTYSAGSDLSVWAVDPRLLMEGEALCQVYWLDTRTMLFPRWKEYRRIPPDPEEGSDTILALDLDPDLDRAFTGAANTAMQRPANKNWVTPLGIDAPFVASQLEAVLIKHRDAVVREQEARMIWAATSKQIPMNKED
jgi:hypothetical protein